MQEHKGTEGNADPQALIFYAQAEAQQPREKESGTWPSPTS
jgi:hypothetical protein